MGVRLVQLMLAMLRWAMVMGVRRVLLQWLLYGLLCEACTVTALLLLLRLQGVLLGMAPLLP